MTKQKRKSIPLSLIFNQSINDPQNTTSKNIISESNNTVLSIISDTKNIGVLHHIIENVKYCTMNLSGENDINNMIQSINDGVSDFGIILTNEAHHVCAKVNKNNKIMAIVANNIKDIKRAKKTFTPNILCIYPKNVSDPIMLINTFVSI